MGFPKKYILLLIILSFAVFNLAYSQSDSIKLKRISERKLTKKIIANYYDYENLSLKINAKVINSDKTHNLNISYRNIKDSVIWININHNTGIPVARFLITPDSTKMLNRIDKKYLAMSNQQIVLKFGYDISFDMIQSIFTAQLVNLEPRKEAIQTYKHYKVYQDSGQYVLQNIKKKKLNRLHKKEKIDEYLIHKIIVSPNFNIFSTSLEDNVNSQKIEVVYSSYDGDNIFPKELNLSFKKKDIETTMDLKIKKTKLNKDKLSFSFKIPEKYERVTLD